MMFIAWSGRGLWIVGALLLALCGAAGYCKLVNLPMQDRIGTVLVAFLLAGLFCIALGVQARTSTPRPVFERRTGRELMRRPVHSFYWIRAEYWGLFYLLTAVWILLSRLH